MYSVSHALIKHYGLLNDAIKMSISLSFEREANKSFLDSLLFSVTEKSNTLFISHVKDFY